MDPARWSVSFKAGRATRREGTNWVDPEPTKGTVAIAPGQEDGLLHFYWVNRESSNVEEDLILFPGDASFVPVNEAPGARTYVLKFTSSNQRLFFWMQDKDQSKDAELVLKLNNVLSDQDETMATSGAEDAASPVGQVATSVSQTAPLVQPSNATTAGTSAEELARLQALLRSMGTRGGASRPRFAEPELSLSHVLTSTNLQSVLSNPNLLQHIVPCLPSDLPVPPTADAVRRIVESPPFQASVRQLDQALATGMLQGLVVGLGLPGEAGSSVGAFLRAINEQAKRTPRGTGDGMDTT